MGITVRILCEAIIRCNIEGFAIYKLSTHGICVLCIKDFLNGNIHAQCNACGAAYDYIITEVICTIDDIVGVLVKIVEDKPVAINHYASYLRQNHEFEELIQFYE